MTDESVRIMILAITLKDTLGFYVVRSGKDGTNDCRDFAIRVKDPGTKLVNLKTARENPNRWDLKPTNPTPSRLTPIPVLSGEKDQGVIMDSNHLLANLKCEPSTKLPFVLVTSDHPENLLDDYKILIRSK